MKELRAEFPLWLEYSGLPAYLNENIRRDAWSIFKKLVELECALNQTPGSFEISAFELAERLGIDSAAVRKVLELLKKKKIIACYLPDHEEEKALIEIITPIQTPVSPSQIKKDYREVFVEGSDFFRYYDVSLEEDNENDPELQKVVSLYFNSISLKMNTFILDELRLIRKKFPIDKIEKVFFRAKNLASPSLSWVIKELYRIGVNDKESK